jgi:hypothetical protein
MLGAIITPGALPGKATLVLFAQLPKFGNKSQLPITHHIVTHDVLAALRV